MANETALKSTIHKDFRTSLRPLFSLISCLPLQAIVDSLEQTPSKAGSETSLNHHPYPLALLSGQALMVSEVCQVLPLCPKSHCILDVFSRSIGLLDPIHEEAWQDPLLLQMLGAPQLPTRKSNLFLYWSPKSGTKATAASMGLQAHFVPTESVLCAGQQPQGPCPVSLLETDVP